MTHNMELLGEYISLTIRNTEVKELKDGEVKEIELPELPGVRFGLDNQYYLFQWQEGKGWVAAKPTSMEISFPNLGEWVKSHDRLELIKTIQRWSPGFVQDVNFMAANEHLGFNFKWLLEVDLNILRSIVKTLISKS